MYGSIKTKVHNALASPMSMYLFGIGVGSAATIVGLRASGPMVLTITPSDARAMLDSSANFVMYTHRVLGPAIVKMAPEVL